MYSISSIEELLKLKSGEKFIRIRNGSETPCLFVAPHPKYPSKIAIAVKTGDVKSPVAFSQFDFTCKTDFLDGDYNSADVGNTIISQLEGEAQIVREVYLKIKRAK